MHRHRAVYALVLTALLATLGLRELRAGAAASPTATPAASPAATPAASPAATPTASPRPTRPAAVLDLDRWKLTLPVETAHAGSPDEIRQPELATFALAPYFAVNEAGDGVRFRAPCGGATTRGSGYPRAELREMSADGAAEAAWATETGRHTLLVRQAITHLPRAKPHVVAGQVHDADDDVIMIRLEGEHLFVEGDGKELGDLDPQYVLGTVFTVQVVVAAGSIQVYYNDLATPKVTLPNVRQSGCYFKAGCYTQSNTKKGDAADDYGEVVIHELRVTHE